MIDDLGWSDVSWRQDTGVHQVQTPVMNDLKMSGILLNQFYVPKDCAPSRASMMTGRWPFRVGYYGNPGDDGGVPETFEFLPQMLYRRYGFLCHHVRAHSISLFTSNLLCFNIDWEMASWLP